MEKTEQNKALESQTQYTRSSTTSRFFFSFLKPKCTKIWHDKQRENETIPIWNLTGALAKNSVHQ
uniref:Uncharacterized protein n=1 Tax=Anguilla anguilla TaxID=7936 RepID=A0A0E9X4Z9_ANGAN